MWLFSLVTEYRLVDVGRRKEPLEGIWSNCLLKQGHLEAVAQDHD